MNTMGRLVLMLQQIKLCKKVLQNIKKKTLVNVTEQKVAKNLLPGKNNCHSIVIVFCVNFHLKPHPVLQWCHTDVVLWFRTQWDFLLSKNMNQTAQNATTLWNNVITFSPELFCKARNDEDDLIRFHFHLNMQTKKNHLYHRVLKFHWSEGVD